MEAEIVGMARHRRVGFGSSSDARSPTTRLAYAAIGIAGEVDRERPRARQKAGYRRRDALERGRQGVSDGLFAISVRIYIGDPRPAGVPGRISWRVARSIMQLH